MVLMAPVLPAEDLSKPAEASESAEAEAREPEAATPPITLPAQTSADPYAIGPDAHERVPDAPDQPQPAYEPQTSQAPQESHAPQEPDEPVTDKGLPKRTPRISAPAPAARPRNASVDAEALRRRLGGFHQGANHGRRDVEAEIAERTSGLQQPAAHAVETKGDTVEEASS